MMKPDKRPTVDRARIEAMVREALVRDQGTAAAADRVIR